MKSQTTPKNSGFTLVELLVSIGVLALLMVMVFSMVDSTQKAWKRSQGKVEQFKSARIAFEMITRRMSQATLNAYWSYDNPVSPKEYVRQSNLHFVCGPATALDLSSSNSRKRYGQAAFFQVQAGYTEVTTPTGTGQKLTFSDFDSMLNGWGYYVEYYHDKDLRPSFLQSNVPGIQDKYRFRLMEMRIPAEIFTIYGDDLNNSGSSTPRTSRKDYYKWFTNPYDPETTSENASGTGARSGELADVSRPVADNVVLLLFSPRLSEGDTLTGGSGNSSGNDRFDIAPNYEYDSREFQWGSATSERVVRNRNQLPPLVQVTMVAIDEESAVRLAALDGDGAHGGDTPPSGIERVLASAEFSDATKYDDDIDALERAMADEGINYRVFTTVVNIREAKWSTTFIEN